MHERGKKMNQKMVVTIVLGVLLLFSVVQTVQLAGLRGKVASGDLSLETTKTTSKNTGIKAGASAPAPADIASLPGMVGGC